MVNATKSKCVIVKPSRICIYRTKYGNQIEIVNRWTHLGHIINCLCKDSAAITIGRNSLIGKISNVLYMFISVGTVVKVKLMKAYCSCLHNFVEFITR